MKSLVEIKRLIVLALCFALLTNCIVAFPNGAPRPKVKGRPASGGESSSRPLAAPSGPLMTADTPQPMAAPDAARSEQAFARLPLRFEANLGQTDPSVKFISRGSGLSLFMLASAETVFSLARPARSQAGNRSFAANSLEETIKRQGDVVRMKLAGANLEPRVEGVDPLPGITNYFIGNDPSQWRTDDPTYGRVRYAQVYPGIDLIFYGDHRQLEYDLSVGPHADPSRIKLSFRGARKLSLDGNGDLILHGSGGEIRMRQPVAYQEANGLKTMVAARYVIKGKRRAGFRLAHYDHNLPLVIDPVIAYSTFLGGDNSDQGNSIAVDSQGNTYIAGNTNSLNYPTANPYQTSNPFRRPSAFITKINAAGTALVYSTYLNGTGNSGGGSSEGDGIAVDPSGNAYIIGGTTAPDFPLMNPFQTSGFIFVTKLNAAGNALVYSTRFGGTNGTTDLGRGIAVDSSGNAYITGQAGSTDFPTTPGAFQRVFGGFHDVFVTKFQRGRLVARLFDLHWRYGRRLRQCDCD
jgi:hypothetical protein